MISIFSSIVVILKHVDSCFELRNNAHTSIAGIQLHRLKAFMLLQHTTGPLPNTAHVRLAAELISLLSDGDWVPVFESNVGFFQVNEKIVGVRTSWCARVAIYKSA